MGDWTFVDPATGRARQHMKSRGQPEPVPGLHLVEGRWLGSEYRFGPDLVPILDPLPATVAVISADLVKREAARRLQPTDWMVIRAAEGGPAVSPDVLAARQLIRDRSGAIEAMEPIPQDFRADHYWEAE